MQWWYVVKCGCGLHEPLSALNFEHALAQADAVAHAHLAREPYCCPRLEYVTTLPLPITADLGEPVSQSEMRALLRGDPCSYCGAPCEQLDHIHARSMGGSDGTDNLTAACRSCNIQKKARDLLPFLVTR